MELKIKVEYITKTITYLIGLIGFISVFRHIGLIYTLLFLCLFIIAIYSDCKRFFYIPRWLVNTISLIIISFSVLRINLDDPATPIVEALLLLLAVKFLEEKRFRDYMQIYAITVFLLAGSALMSIDMIFLLYFLLLIFLLSIAIVMLTYYSEDKAIVLARKTTIKIITRTSLIPLIAIPATLLMFAILPRTAYPIFDFLTRGSAASTGFTDNITLGSISGLQEDGSVIFRAAMKKINEGSLYWRGITLELFDGISWKPIVQDMPSGQEKVKTSGKPITQTIYLEPYENKYIFSLDKPISISLKNTSKTEGLTYYIPEGIFRKTRYEAVSLISDVLFEKDIHTEKYLQLPEREDFREIKKLVNDIAYGLEDEKKIKALLKFLKEGDFRYSLKKLPVSKTPLKDFLFNHKYGNCEYFASAMAVMLRIAGIPSRLVGGYLGGYYNDAGGYYMVMQKNAHVWVEAYLKDKWVRIDPTPVNIDAFVASEKHLIKIRLLFDTLSYYWNSLVINYDLQKQFSLVQKISSGIKRPRFGASITKRDIIRYSAILLLISACILIFYSKMLKRIPLEKRLINNFEKKLKRYGYEREKSEGLEELTARIKEKWLKEKAHKFVREFEKIYYMDKAISSNDLRRLKMLIRDIKKDNM